MNIIKFIPLCFLPTLALLPDEISTEEMGRLKKIHLVSSQETYRVEYGSDGQGIEKEDSEDESVEFIREDLSLSEEDSEEECVEFIREELSLSDEDSEEECVEFIREDLSFSDEDSEEECVEFIREELSLSDEDSEDECDEFFCEGLSLSDKESEELRSKIQPLLNCPINQKLLKEIKQTIILYYRKINRPLVIVQIPEQDITEGDITIEIMESRLGNIDVRGNKYFRDRRYSNSIRLCEEEPIRADTLAEDLAWLNLNPFRRVDAVYVAGQNGCTTDIDLTVCDRFPLDVYAGVDNTGIREIGNSRVFAGFNWGNAFGLDHILSYEFISSYDYHQFWAHAVSYTAPLSWRHILVVFGGYSEVHAHLQDNLFHTHGTNLQASGRYQIPLKAKKSFTHEVSFGADFKRTNNTVEFGGFSFINHFANLFQFMGRYSLTYAPPAFKTFFDVEIYFSPAQLVPDMTDKLYNQLRLGARTRYIYGRVFWTDEIVLGKGYRLNLSVRGQLASANLLPSEQMGLGGYNTVRGYFEREVNVDNALILNVEAKTPVVNVLDLFSRKRKYCDGLSGLLFADYAFGMEHHREAFDKRTYNLLGVGPGIRYHIGDWFIARADLGIRLIKAVTDVPRARLHFAVTANY